MALPDSYFDAISAKRRAERPQPAEGELEMPRYARDPDWITARRPDQCTRGAAVGCRRQILPGDRVFYYPATKSAYCVECSPAVAARAAVELAADDAGGF